MTMEFKTPVHLSDLELPAASSSSAYRVSSPIDVPSLPLEEQEDTVSELLESLAKRGADVEGAVDQFDLLYSFVR